MIFWQRICSCSRRRRCSTRVVLGGSLLLTRRSPAKRKTAARSSARTFSGMPALAKPAGATNGFCGLAFSMWKMTWQMQPARFLGTVPARAEIFCSGCSAPWNGIKTQYQKFQRKERTRGLPCKDLNPRQAYDPTYKNQKKCLLRLRNAHAVIARITEFGRC